MGNIFTLTEKQKFETKLQNALTFLNLSFEDLQFVNPKELAHCRNIGKATVSYAIEKLRSEDMRIGYMSLKYYEDHKSKFKGNGAITPDTDRALGGTFVWLVNETTQITGAGQNEYIIADTLMEAISMFEEENVSLPIFSIRKIAGALIKR